MEDDEYEEEGGEQGEFDLEAQEQNFEEEEEEDEEYLAEQEEEKRQFVDEVWSEMVAFFAKSTFFPEDLLYNMIYVEKSSGQGFWISSSDHPITKQLIANGFKKTDTLRLTKLVSHLYLHVYSDEVIQDAIDELVPIFERFGKTFEKTDQETPEDKKE